MPLVYMDCAYKHSQKYPAIMCTLKCTGQYLGHASYDESGPLSQLPSWNVDVLFMQAERILGKIKGG